MEGIEGHLRLRDRTRGSPSRSRLTCRSRRRGSNACARREGRRTPAGSRRCGRVSTTRSPPSGGRRPRSDSAGDGGRTSHRHRSRRGRADARRSRRSATTRSTICPTVSHAIRSSPAIGFLAICCASQATTSSKSRVWCASGLAHGTGSRCTPQSRQRSRRSSHSITQRHEPRSKCRQRLTRRSWICSCEPVCPQREQILRRRRELHGHDHPLGTEADIDDRCAGQAQQPLECCRSTHLVLLWQVADLSTASSLPGRASACLTSCATFQRDQ